MSYRRVSERDVPESQHTIFVRGLPGATTTDQVREFFEKEFGEITFDFVKVSPDRQKLYVAVRFSNKQVARECMEKYAEGEIMGHRAELSWFRDIRRYISHCQKQGIPLRPLRRSGAGDDDRVHGSGDGRGGDRRQRSRTRSRSPSRGRDRSVSGSPLAHGGGRRSRSVDGERADGRGSRSPSRSLTRSRSSTPEGARNRRNRPRKSEDEEESASPSPPPVKKSKKERKRERRNRRRRERRERSISRSVSRSDSGSPPPAKRRGRSEDEDEENEQPPPRSRLREIKQELVEDMELEEGGGDQQHQVKIGPQKTKTTHLQPSLSAMPAAYKGVPPPDSSAGSPAKTNLSLRNSSVTIDLKSNNPPETRLKHGFYEDQYIEQQQQRMKSTNQNGGNVLLKGAFLAPSGVGSVVKENGGFLGAAGGVPPPIPAYLSKQEMVGAGGVEGGGLVGAAFTNFNAIQRDILKTIRYVPPERDSLGTSGTLRLSSLSKANLSEAQREDKLAKLSPDLRDRVERKKLELELSYRNDCETYSFVTNKLISKDKNIEERIRMSLLEVMKELEADAVKLLDAYIDDLMVIA